MVRLRLGLIACLWMVGLSVAGPGAWGAAGCPDSVVPPLALPAVKAALAANAEVTVVARRRRYGVRSLDELPDLLPRHDVVVVALPQTPQTAGLVDAAFLAARPDHDRVRELRGMWLQLTTRDIFPGGTLTRVGHLVRQRPYLFSSAALARLIEDWRPADRLEDLPVPVRVVTTPLGGDGAVYHRHGDLARLAEVPCVPSLERGGVAAGG